MGSFNSHLKWLILLSGIILASIRPMPSTPISTTEYIWVSLGPDGSSVEAITGNSTEPQVLYIGVWGEGVFRSTNGGATWLYSSDGLTDTMVTTLVTTPFSPTALYAGTYNGNLFHSADGGVHWHLRPGCSQFMQGNPLFEVALDPTNPNVLYLMYYVTLLAKSEDGGISCHQIGPGWPNLFMYDLMVDPVTPTVLYLGTNQGVLRSIDGGNTWGVVGLENSVVFALSAAPSLPDVLYAGTLNGVYKSVDHGEHWQEISTGLTNKDVRALAVDPDDADIVYAAIYTALSPSDTNLFQTRNGGVNWMPAGTGWGNPQIWQIFISSPSVYVGTANSGVFKRVEVVSTVFLPLVLRR